MREVAVPQTSRMVGRTEAAMRALPARHHSGILRGVRLRERLPEVEIQAGDLLLFWAPRTPR